MSLDRKMSIGASRHIHVADQEYLSISEGRIRIRIGAAIFMFVLMVAVLRLAEVSLLSGGKIRTNGQSLVDNYRADIVDRNGVLLATTLDSYALYARSKYVWNIEETAGQLAGVLPELSADVIQRRLEKGGDQILIKRGLTPRQKQQVFQLGLPGMIFESEPNRVYPGGNLGAHLVGFSDVDMKGLAGAERAFNQELSMNNAPALMLSMDLRVQNIVAEELQFSIDKFKAKTGVGIIMDVRTGEIVAMASLPNFDPNQPGASLPQNLYNHASMSTYELGSVFKPITMAMALEYKITDLEERFPVQQPLKIRDRLISDDHPSRVPLAMPEVMAESSNRGTALMALRAGGDTQQAFLRALGLMDRVPVELVESAAPQVQSEWQDITTVTVSYGHGISVTPLSLITAVSALVNGGEYVEPTIRKRDTVHQPVKRRVVSEETSRTVRDLLRYVATDGTGRNADVRGYSVMGKTGTADKPSRNGYDEKRLVTSFIAAFPYQDPQYAVLISLDEPQAVEGTYGYATAGWNAAPTVKRIIQRVGPVLGVRRDSGPVAYSPFSKKEAIR